MIRLLLFDVHHLWLYVLVILLVWPVGLMNAATNACCDCAVAIVMRKLHPRSNLVQLLNDKRQ